MDNEIKQCKRCIMDDVSDPNIYFDNNGYCNYCNHALLKLNEFYLNHKIDKEIELNKIINTLKVNGLNKSYDCLMGLSGGLDSSYLAYLGAVKWGLRICAVHIDDGFDSDLAVSNINNLCKRCNIDLINVKPDAEQYISLTKAFIKAEVPNLAIPQDNILFATLYQYAKNYKIKYFLSGSNIATESIIQKGNTHSNLDKYHIKKINKKFGTCSINKLHLFSEYKSRMYGIFLGIKTMAPLDYIDYNKGKAILELKQECSYEYYEAKHLENLLTKVIQLRWFVEKFNVDKRKSHLSSLIVSGQITREEALGLLNKPLYDIEKMEKDIEFVLNRLNIERVVFEELLRRKGKQHTDYPTDKLYPWIIKHAPLGIKKIVKKMMFSIL